MMLQHAPGVPKVLIGNRLHLAFKRRISIHEAELYAYKNGMAFFEVSPLCNFNIQESFSALSRMALLRNGMEHLWRTNRGICFIIFFPSKFNNPKRSHRCVPSIIASFL